jgi:hypothetical protein
MGLCLAHHLDGTSIISELFSKSLLSELSAFSRAMIYARLSFQNGRMAMIYDHLSRPFTNLSRPLSIALWQSASSTLVELHSLRSSGASLSICTLRELSARISTFVGEFSTCTSWFSKLQRP